MSKFKMHAIYSRNEKGIVNYYSAEGGCLIIHCTLELDDFILIKDLDDLNSLINVLTKVSEVWAKDKELNRGDK